MVALWPVQHVAPGAARGYTHRTVDLFLEGAALSALWYKLELAIL